MKSWYHCVREEGCFLFISPKPEEKNNFVTEGNWNIESFNWKSTERTIKKMEGTVWNIDIGVLQRAPISLSHTVYCIEGRVIFLKGDGGIQVKSFRDGMAKIFERSFFFFKDVTKKRALIFFWVITKKKDVFCLFFGGEI